MFTSETTFHDLSLYEKLDFEFAHADDIKVVAEMIKNAKQPIIYAGGGVILGRASGELTELAKMLNFPVTNTLMGLGGYPATDRQSVGMLGMHGSYEANMAMHNADCILAVGARFDDRVTNAASKFCPHAKIIQIDIDPSSISKNVNVDIPIVGPVRSVLKEMIGMVQQSEANERANIELWWKDITIWRGRNASAYRTDDSLLLKPQAVVEKLWELTNGDAYITSDVGQHQMFAAQYYKFDKPNRWINSGGLGTMGVGIPYAMGIKLAKPDSEVFCVTGEGSVQMCIQELSTCFQYNTPIKVLALRIKPTSSLLYAMSVGVPLNGGELSSSRYV